MGVDEVTKVGFLVPLFAEFLGTALLVLIGCASCISWTEAPSVLHIALTFGLAVASLAHVSITRIKKKTIDLLRFFFGSTKVQCPYNKNTFSSNQNNSFMCHRTLKTLCVAYIGYKTYYVENDCIYFLSC